MRPIPHHQAARSACTVVIRPRPFAAKTMGIVCFLHAGIESWGVQQVIQAFRFSMVLPRSPCVAFFIRRLQGEIWIDVSRLALRYLCLAIARNHNEYTGHGERKYPQLVWRS